MTRSAPTLLSLLAFTLLAALCLTQADDIQTRLRDQITTNLSTANLTGIQVSTDGLDVTLTGTLPNEAALAEARSIASTHPATRRLTNRLTLGRPGGLRLVSAARELTLSGTFAEVPTRQRVLDATAALWADRYDATALALDPHTQPVKRPDALVSIIALLRDSPGTFDLTWGPAVDVEGEVASEEAKASFLSRLGALTADWPITERIRVTPRALSGELARLLAERKVEFASDSARLSEAGRELLDEIARRLAEAPEVRFVIEGHTDSQASEAQNLALSRRRAAAVRDHLVEAGLDAGRFETLGLGESRPVASNETEEGRRRNRRVAFRLVEEEAP